jgi:hypothetical protein
MESTGLRKHPEYDHAPRPVVWSEPLWDLVRTMRGQATLLRSIRQDAAADVRDVDADQLVAALIQAEGDTWVDTERAIQLTQGKADTIRSWARRGTVRAAKAGGDWLYHRDDLLRTAQEATARRAQLQQAA